MLKKNISLLLIVVILIGILTVFPIDFKPTAATTETHAVYFVNNYSWDKVYCYFWKAANNGNPAVVPDNYPGIKMNKCGMMDGYNVYYVWFNNIGYDMVLFNDGSGRGNSQSYTAHTDDLALDYEKIYFENGYEYADSEYVYYINTHNWGNLHCYYYKMGSDISDPVLWPGTSMEKYGTYLGYDVYKVYIGKPCDTMIVNDGCGGIINNNDGTYTEIGQTIDIRVERGKAYYIDHWIDWTDSTDSHEINSDPDNTHCFYFEKNEEIEDLVYSKPSTEYNPRLAHFLACMARSAYTSDLVKENYAKLGFDGPEEQHCDSGDPIAGFYVGEKKLADGKKLVMVTIRGTDDWSEWLQTNFNLGNSAMIASSGLHSGFLASAQKIYEYLSEHYDGTPPGDLIFVVTGHSLGAAVGNILAKWLDSSEVPTDCLYAYNFACPNIGIGSDDISIWNKNGMHNNIINVSNWCDLVSHEPGLGVEFLSLVNRLLCGMNGWHKWKRFGVSYWFNNGTYNWKDAHDMGVYLDYLEKEYDETHFTQNEYKVKAVSVHCPVDVVVYDSKGNPIAGTINNEPNYYGYQPGEKALIFVDGDRKLFHVFNNEAFEVKLVGTDVGEMEYGVSTGDMTSGDVYSEKWFESVPLTNGKEMIGKNVNVLDEATNTLSQDEKLIAVGDTPSEILSNGEEVAYSVRYILGDADNNGIIEAVDTALIQRKLADIETEYYDEVLQQGDADGNGELDLPDVTAIQYYLAKMKTPYLIGADVV